MTRQVVISFLFNIGMAWYARCLILQGVCKPYGPCQASGKYACKYAGNDTPACCRGAAAIWPRHSH